MAQRSGISAIPGAARQWLAKFGKQPADTNVEEGVGASILGGMVVFFLAILLGAAVAVFSPGWGAGVTLGILLFYVLQ